MEDDVVLVDVLVLLDVVELVLVDVVGSVVVDEVVVVGALVVVVDALVVVDVVGADEVVVVAADVVLVVVFGEGLVPLLPPQAWDVRSKPTAHPALNRLTRTRVIEPSTD